MHGSLENIPNAEPRIIGGTLLDIHDLSVEFATRRGIVSAVSKVDLTIAKGETVAIVGESGSGKSVTSYALMRILERTGRIAAGTVIFSGLNLRVLPEATMRDLRGRELSMIFQNPRAALNPIRKIGHQIEDVLRAHAQTGSGDAKRRAIEALEQVKIARPQERYHAYPFELSGGMCQRVVIALALACRPQLLIADEPTTGLDVTTQKAVMDLITELTRQRGMATLLITHDLGLAAAYADRVVVMEKGRVVETAQASTIFSSPNHAYTRKLMRATPRPGAQLCDLLPDEDDASKTTPVVSATTAPAGAPLLVIEDLIKDFPRAKQGHGIGALFGSKKSAQSPQGQTFRAVNGLSFTIQRGENVGLVGESGCGKSTTSLMITRLLDPTAGRISFNGVDIAAIPAREFAVSDLRSRIQMVFQDPTDSLNPRFTAARAIADPLLRFPRLKPGETLRLRCEHLAKLVGLPLDLLDRFPHQLSGGQKARVGIARAIALDPDLIILDEPTAALDVSVQAVVLNLLQELKSRLKMSYLFVSHDLNVVRLLCDRLIVMRGGEIIEEGETQNLLDHPKHEYTQKLIAAIPKPPH